MTKLVQVPKEKLRAKRALVVEMFAGEGVAKIDRSLAYDLRAPAPLATVDLTPSPVGLYLDSLNTDVSRATMLSSLEKIAKMLAPSMGITYIDPPKARNGAEKPISPAYAFPWHKLNAGLVAGLRKDLLAKCAIATANLRLAALKGVLRACAPLKLMTYEDVHSALYSAARIKGHTEPPGRALPQEDVEALIAACDTTTIIGQRDAAMIVLFFGCGLRKAEVAKATIGSLSFQLKTSSSLLVEGKGRKQRRVFLSAGAFKIVDTWLKVRGTDEGPFLLTCDPNHGGAIDTRKRGMSFSAIYKRVVELAKRAGIAHVSPHDLRRTYITDLLKSGVDLATTSKMVGHSGVATTQIYDRRGEEERQAASDKFQEERFGKMTGETPKSAKKRMETQAKKGTKKR